MYYIVGNKSDLDEQGLRQVSYEEGEQWVDEYKEEFCDEDDEIDIQYIEVSAMNGTNVKPLFDQIALKLIQNYNNQMGIKYGEKSLIIDDSKSDTSKMFQG